MTTATQDADFKTDSDAVGIRSSALFGLVSLQDALPENGQIVILLWESAGQITAGDYFGGVFRDAAANYNVIETPPTHWMPWPSNWPNAQGEAQSPAKDL